MQVIFEHTQDENDEIKTFYFIKPANFRYTAGQFIELYLPHENSDKRGQKHWFTLSSSPTQAYLTITTRHFAKNGSSFKQQLFSLKPGDKVDMSEPMGDFVLPKDPSIPLVFVAGGIGVTPFHSIVQWLLDTNEQRSIQMLYVSRDQKDLIFLDTFNKFDMELQTLTKQQLTADLIYKHANGLDDKLIFISGPEPMTEALVDQFKAMGFLYDQLVTDYFPGYSAF